MDVTIVNTKTDKSIICSMSEAAKLIGVSRSCLYNWKSKWVKEKKKETFNHFDIYFDSETIKQKPRGVGK